MVDCRCLTAQRTRALEPPFCVKRQLPLPALHGSGALVTTLASAALLWLEWGTPQTGCGISLLLFLRFSPEALAFGRAHFSVLPVLFDFFVNYQFGWDDFALG